MKQLGDILSKKTTEWFYDDLYGINIYITEIKQEKKIVELLKEIEKEFGDVDTDPSNGKMVCANGDYLIILKNKKDLRSLTHEIIHIVFDLFDSRGIPITYENDETFAYYYSYLYINIKNIALNLK